MRTLIIAAACIGLSGCASVSIPASGVSSDGVKWAGYFDFKQFNISSQDTICSGKPSMGMGKVNTHNFTCDNGRSGQVITTRTSMTGGIGEIRFDNGVTGTIKYGN